LGLRSRHIAAFGPLEVPMNVLHTPTVRRSIARWQSLYRLRPTLSLFALLIVFPALAVAQSPFDSGFTAMQTLFTGTIAKVSDIIAGKIGEHQIPQDVLDAFHLQYPNMGFVETVREHASDPDAVAGLVNGIKGKLFEDRYLVWLNDGHLPDGLHAELAHSANNPAWDIAIKDSHGHISELLQAKATSSMGYVREALNAHPDIDVVVTGEVFDSLSQHGDDLAHVINSHENLTTLTDHVGDAISQADAADVAFNIPFIAIG
jgi:hypothetical protein